MFSGTDACFCESPVFFCVRSTKRVDHSNTRLASQLDRNPGEIRAHLFPITRLADAPPSLQAPTTTT